MSGVFDHSRASAVSSRCSLRAHRLRCSRGPSARGRMSMALATALVASRACGGDVRPPPTRPGAPVVATSAETDRAPAIATVPFRTRFEIAVDVPARALAPDDVRIEARFTSPSGVVLTTGGFASHGSHRVRFTAREVGLYGYVVRADGGDGLREVARGQVEGRGRRRERLRRPSIRQDRHRLERDDGEAVHVLGENRIEVGEVDTQATSRAWRARG